MKASSRDCGRGWLPSGAATRACRGTEGRQAGRGNGAGEDPRGRAPPPESPWRPRSRPTLLPRRLPSAPRRAPSRVVWGRQLTVPCGHPAAQPLAPRQGCRGSPALPPRDVSHSEVRRLNSSRSALPGETGRAARVRRSGCCSARALELTILCSRAGEACVLPDTSRSWREDSARTGAAPPGSAGERALASSPTKSAGSARLCG